MRNLFDQYNQPENRLSHALAVCLDEDRRFLREFLAWVGVKPPVRVADLTVIEQSLRVIRRSPKRKPNGRDCLTSSFTTAAPGAP